MGSGIGSKISEQKHSYWWEDIFYRSLEQKDINGLFWAEVDYIEDYE